jgi:hypothetical protein
VSIHDVCSSFARGSMVPYYFLQSFHSKTQNSIQDFPRTGCSIVVPAGTPAELSESKMIRECVVLSILVETVASRSNNCEFNLSSNCDQRTIRWWSIGYLLPSSRLTHNCLFDVPCQSLKGRFPCVSFGLAGKIKHSRKRDNTLRRLHDLRRLHELRRWSSSDRTNLSAPADW